MSKKKARLINCNDWNYYQYYNTYLTKGTTLETTLKHKQSKVYNYVRVKHLLWLSKNDKFIVSGVTNSHSKYNYKYIKFNYPLYRRKYFQRYYTETFNLSKKFELQFIHNYNNSFYYTFNNYLFNFELTNVIDPENSLIKFNTSQWFPKGIKRLLKKGYSYRDVRFEYLGIKNLFRRQRWKFHKHIEWNEKNKVLDEKVYTHSHWAYREERNKLVIDLYKGWNYIKIPTPFWGEKL